MRTRSQSQGSSFQKASDDTSSSATLRAPPIRAPSATRERLRPRDLRAEIASDARAGAEHEPVRVVDVEIARDVPVDSRAESPRKWTSRASSPARFAFHPNR